MPSIPPTEVALSHLEALLDSETTVPTVETETDPADALHWEAAALARLMRVPEGFMRDACRQRLVRVPGFLLPMVKNRAEAYVNQLGEDRVTSKHLAELSAARFGAAGPPQLSGLDMASLRKQKKI